jgi:DNA-binding YbaB/EbfC family protein
MNQKFMMRQVQELQAKLAKAQQELAEMTTEASSGGGAVKIFINGEQKIMSVTISPEVLSSNDIELLQDLVQTAVNEAVTKSKEMAAAYLSPLTAGIKIPGML